MKRKSQCERMAEAMADGRWTPNERFIEMHIPDYRRRMCDLREQYPHRYISRERTRRRRDGSTYVMKDWRDLWATLGCFDDIIPQLAIARAWDAEHDLAPTETVAIEYKGETLYLTRGQLRLWSNNEAAMILLARYIDPWRGEGVRE